MFETMRRLLTPLTILASFGNDALTIAEAGSRPGMVPSQPVAIPYREHPEVFEHPRYLVADIDQGAALVSKAIYQLAKGRFPLIAPQIVVSIARSLPGGVAGNDRKMLEELFTKAGARKVVWKNA
jgi:hypothetical protein